MHCNKIRKDRWPTDQEPECLPAPELNWSRTSYEALKYLPQWRTVSYPSIAFSKILHERKQMKSHYYTTKLFSPLGNFNSYTYHIFSFVLAYLNWACTLLSCRLLDEGTILEWIPYNHISTSVELLPCSCLNRPSRILAYCTWLTNAAGDKLGSLFLWSQSMAISQKKKILAKVFLSDVEWMGVLLHSTDKDATLSTEIYPQSLPADKSLAHTKKFFILFSNSTRRQIVAAFRNLQCLTLSRESTAVSSRAGDVFPEEPSD